MCWSLALLPLPLKSTGKPLTQEREDVELTKTLSKRNNHLLFKASKMCSCLLRSTIAAENLLIP